MSSCRVVLASLTVFVLIAAVTACSGGISSSQESCGPSPCGACQSGFGNVDRCEDGEWRCSCVPGSATDASSNEDANEESDSNARGNMPPSGTCEDKLAQPGVARACVADDWGESCASGCLTCTCNAGMWGCTTSDECFGDGG